MLVNFFVQGEHVMFALYVSTLPEGSWKGKKEWDFICQNPFSGASELTDTFYFTDKPELPEGCSQMHHWVPVEVVNENKVLWGWCLLAPYKYNLDKCVLIQVVDSIP